MDLVFWGEKKKSFQFLLKEDQKIEVTIKWKIKMFQLFCHISFNETTLKWDAFQPILTANSNIILSAVFTQLI